jgi:glycosyltransferase involved in cell wall biosynthesis
VEWKVVMKSPTDLSVVIPTLNSERFLERTLAQVTAALIHSNLRCEIIVVDDGSSDNTFQVLSRLATKQPANVPLEGIRLARNYGQHSATLCGLSTARGRIVATIDDDLQNDPYEILPILPLLDISKPQAIIVSYPEQQKSLIRKVGSRVVGLLVQTVFRKPAELKFSPFRVLTRPLVDQICRTSNPKPLIFGEILKSATTLRNVPGRHQNRVSEGSRYRLRPILALVWTTIFSYSNRPLVFVTQLALSVSVLSLIGTGVILIRSRFGRGFLPGWTSEAIMISSFAAMNFLVLAVLGLYIGQILKRLSNEKSFLVSESVESSQQ